ncbi:hypothetical protein Bca4012_092902 [Brassica carinata]
MARQLGETEMERVLGRYRMACIGSNDKSWCGCKRWRLSAGGLWAAAVNPDHWHVLSFEVC